MASSATQNRVFDITSWYNNKESYPDLTLKLDDGTTILAHKSVLCTSNTHFENLCAPTTPHGKPKSTIRVDDEPADTVRALVRMIYGLPIPEAGEHSWCFWVDLVTTAKHYLEPALSEKAVDSFLDVTHGMTDVDAIVHMIGVVAESKDVDLKSAVNVVRKHHALILLEHEGYRDAIFDELQLTRLHLYDLLARVKDNSEGTRGGVQGGTFVRSSQSLSNR